MRAHRTWSIGVLGVAVAAFAWVGWQRQEATVLRAQIDALQQEKRQLETLRVRHDHLVATKASDAEIERLRNDRAVLLRLRAEINQLEERVRKTSRTAPRPEGRDGR